MSVDKAKIQEQLADHLRKRILAKGVVMTPETPFAELGVDSITVIELVMYMEDNFGITLSSEQLTDDNLSSVATLVDRAIAAQTPDQ